MIQSLFTKVQLNRKLTAKQLKRLQIGTYNDRPIYHPDILLDLPFDPSSSQASTDSLEHSSLASDEAPPFHNYTLDTYAAPTLIIDLSTFLLKSQPSLDSLPSDRHPDCQLDKKRFHTRPYFEEFLTVLCQQTSYYFVFAMPEDY